MNMIDTNNDTEAIQSLDISLKQIPFLSIASNLSVNALYKILIKNPDLINMTDEKKETFLSYAIKRNNNPIIDFIIASPLLDLNYQDKNGNTYLHMAVIQQNINLIQTLIDKKISINTQNKDGNTALHFAYYIKNNEIVKILLKNNIDDKIKNNQGLIAEQIIPSNEIEKIAGYEIDMNFDINIYDELKYHQNNIIEEDTKKKNMLKNEDKINKKNIVDSSTSIETQNKNNNSKTEKLCHKNSNKKMNNKLKGSETKNNKSNFILKNSNKVNNKTKNNLNKKNYNGKNNKNDNNKNIKNDLNDNNMDLNDEYKDLVSKPLGNKPFFVGRKISNIDKIYNETDRFIRKESENYSFYAELLKNPIRDSYSSDKKKYSSKTNKNLSNIIENNNISEANSNNENLSSEKDYEKNNNNSILNNINKSNLSNNSNNITIIQNILINCSNKLLLDFLMQIKLQKYYNNLNNNGFDNINMIIENAKNQKYITDDQLKKIGITKAGDRAKILIRIQEKANNFEFTIPKSVYYISINLEKIEDDENVNKLYEWLGIIQLEEYLKNFINNGYYSIDLLFVQLLSCNPLTDEILKNDLGIDKLGYRARIINKLKEECPNYSFKLRESVVTFHSIENPKICSECFIF